MIAAHEPADPLIHEAAVAMARRCRSVVQACLREEGWGDADLESCLVIREGFERLADNILSASEPGGRVYKFVDGRSAAGDST